jgi:hypothetical protein
MPTKGVKLAANLCLTKPRVFDLDQAKSQLIASRTALRWGNISDERTYLTVFAKLSHIITLQRFRFLGSLAPFPHSTSGV